MVEKKIMTLHPQGKSGVNISLEKYDQIKNYIISILRKYGEITFEDLNNMAVRDLTGIFEGKIAWYIVTVKLDLEASNILERVPKKIPQVLRLKD